MPETPDQTEPAGTSLFSDMLRIQADFSHKMIEELGRLAAPASLPLDNPIMSGWAEYAAQVADL